MKKILLVTTVSGFVPQFEMENVKFLQSMGYEIHYATNYNMVSYGKDNKRLDGTGIYRHQVDFVRSPFSKDNIKVYKSLKKIIGEHNFEMIHCHTPMGAAMARIVGKAARVTGTKIVYTAHGFHFFKGAPLQNWLIYYISEYFLSRYTDVLVTINEEDYKNALKMKAKRVVYVPGVGIPVDKLKTKEISDATAFKEELGIPATGKILLSVGELIHRKNHSSIIKALGKLNNPEINYVICGHGEKEEELRALVSELKLESQVFFLGYRKDVSKIYEIADIFVFPSYHEGLSVALMEAMAKGLPVICSKVRGNVDLVLEGKGGCLLEVEDVKGYEERIKRLIENRELCKKYGEFNQSQIEKFDIKNVQKVMQEMYCKELNIIEKTIDANNQIL